MKPRTLLFALPLLALLALAPETRAITPGGGVEADAAPAAPGAEQWPMPVAQFLAGDYLERSDVVLTRRDWDVGSWLIRWFTSSPFSHAALVFRGKDDPGIDRTFVIEAGTSGVDLTKLSDYIDDKSSFLAIKRLKQTWFDPLKQSRVRGVLLDKIKATYDYWALGRIARNVWFGMQNTVQTKETTIETYREREWSPPSEYICSGFVQIGFVETVLEYIRTGALPPSALKEVVFHAEAASRLPDAADWSYLDSETSQTTAAIFKDQNFSELESVTPDDLAKSENLEWLYLIQGGMVSKVSSYDEIKSQAK